jgi:hypothetical protein
MIMIDHIFILISSTQPRPYSNLKYLQGHKPAFFINATG